MSFYILKPASDTEETGHIYPQVQKMKPGYNDKASNSVYALSKAYQHFPDFEPDLDYFIVHSHAKLTDLLSVAPVHGGFLISKKLKEVFEQFNIVSHKFYPAKVQHKKNFYEYYWMHIICDFTNKVDYVKSTFIIYYNYAHDLGNIEIKNKSDLLLKKEKVKQDNPEKTVTIWAKQIQLTQDFDLSLDLFEIGMFDANYYISAPLKGALIENKITGCDITLTNRVIY